MKTVHMLALWVCGLAMPSAVLMAAPFAVYEMEVRTTNYVATGAVAEKIKHYVVRDLDPLAAKALSFAWVTPAAGAVYLTDACGGTGTVDSLASKNKPVSYTTVAIDIVDHPELENMTVSLIGKASRAKQVLAPARKAGTVRGVPVTAAPAVIINDGNGDIPFAPFFTGTGYSAEGLEFTGGNEVLSGLENHRLTLRLLPTLTSAANHPGGVYVPVKKSLPARALPTVAAAGGPKPFLKELLLGLQFAEDDIEDIDPPPTEWFLDFDGDGWGDSSDSIFAVTQPAGYVAQDFDCDDGNASVFPGATEICNGIDDDCDGTNDEDFDLASSVSNCGQCGNVCGNGGNVCLIPVCVAGNCSTVLAANGTQCSAFGFCLNGSCVE